MCGLTRQAYWGLRYPRPAADGALVLACGSQVNFFGTPGADKYAYPLYSLRDAEPLRSRILMLLESVDRNPSLVDQGALERLAKAAWRIVISALAVFQTAADPNGSHGLDLGGTSSCLRDIAVTETRQTIYI
jgi:hypothetical protein